MHFAFWRMVAFTAYTYSLHPEQSSTREQEAYRVFLDRLFAVAPFGDMPLAADGVHPADVLRTVCREAVARADLSSRATVVATLVELYNTAAVRGDRRWVGPAAMALTAVEFTAAFDKYLDSQTAIPLARALQVRLEDHRTIRGLEAELALLRAKPTADEPAKPASDQRAAFPAVAVASVVAVAAVVVLAVAVAVGTARRAAVPSGAPDLLDQGQDRPDRSSVSRTRRGEPFEAIRQ